MFFRTWVDTTSYLTPPMMRGYLARYPQGPSRARFPVGGKKHAPLLLRALAPHTLFDRLCFVATPLAQGPS